MPLGLLFLNAGINKKYFKNLKLNKMKKLLLVFTVAAFLTACNGNSSKTETNSSDSTTVTTPATTDTTTTATSTDTTKTSADTTHKMGADTTHK